MGDIKGTFHARMDMIKDRNSKDLAEAKEIKKRWQEYTEELCKKGLNVPRNHNGMVTHLEPDILECEVKWDLGSIITNKASGGDTVPTELFKILKDGAVEELHSVCQQVWTVATRLEKVSFHSKPKEGQCQWMFSLLYNCTRLICQQGYAHNPSS